MNLTKLGRRIAAVVVAGSALAATAPMPAGAQPVVETSLVYDDADGSGTAPCSTTGYFNGRDLVVVLAAHVVRPGTAAIRVECRMVQDGIIVGTVTAIGAPVAANATTVRVGLLPFSVCSNVYVMYMDGSEAYENGCP